MTIQSKLVTVTNSATPIFIPFTADQAKQSEGGYQASVEVFNAGTVTVYLGGSTVTAGTGTPATAGTPLTAGSYKAIDCGPGDDLYGIVSAGSCDLNVFSSGV